ncbi:MAG: hypothetical protein GX239_07640 [Clostridiaceae bacterium]|nr:hypothetical protein [Clostridiaceae bacterium]
MSAIDLISHRRTSRSFYNCIDIIIIMKTSDFC